MRFHSSLIRLSALAALATGALGSAAMAQAVSAAATYDISHTIATNVPGVTAFPDAPAGFDAVNASPQARAVYGLPPAPDAVAQPESYGKWKKAMSAIAHAKHYAGPLKITDLKSMPAMHAPTVKSAAAAIGGVNHYASLNWSGIVNTNAATKWSKASISSVISEFTVPVVADAFGACSGALELEVSWNGIDGFSNGDVLQGGSLSEAQCNSNVTATAYLAWVEWYPSYPVIGVFPVNPGDDMIVYTFATGPQQGYVFVDDLTLNIYGLYSLAATTPPYLVGNSAEYIVERPCCSGANFYPLANYVLNFWAGNSATNNNSVSVYPGNLTTSTSYVDMVDDGATQIISAPAEVDGKSGLVMEDENCANTGGCTP